MESRFVLGAVALGIVISSASGFVVNESGVGIPEMNRYGYPLVWRVTDLNEPTRYILTNLVVDIGFWIGTSLIALIVPRGITMKWRVTAVHATLFMMLILFVPLGLAMDFVHESGHAIWGTAVGGRLTYMKIAYLEIYPRLAITPHFDLGVARVDGLETDFAHGFMLLGGSMTTNITSWLLALITLGVKLRPKTQLAFRVAGVFGLLDLPFYIVFPQMGLRHWIFLGGSTPEPLRGSRLMGVPDPAFYTMAVLTTVGLTFIHFKFLRGKALSKLSPFQAG